MRINRRRQSLIFDRVRVTWRRRLDHNIQLALIAHKTSTLPSTDASSPRKASTLPCAGGFVFSYSAVHMVSAFAQCVPVNALWDPTIIETDINFDDVLIAFPCLNTPTNILLLTPTLTQLWELTVPTRRERRRMNMLLLGGTRVYRSTLASHLSRIIHLDRSMADSCYNSNTHYSFCGPLTTLT